MRKLALTIATGALLASGVHADWVLGTYPTPTTDSAEVKKLYGPVTFSNSKSKVNLTVPAAGELKLTGTFADEATGTYTANLGLIHPLTKSWEIRSLAGLDSISFDLKLDVKPTEGVGVTISSRGYGGTYNNEGKTYGVLLTGTSVPAVNTWKRIMVPAADLTPPEWWTDGPTPDFPSLDSILTVVEAIQISPKTKYTGTGVKPSTGTVNMSIRNLTLHGVSPRALVNYDKKGCETKVFQVLDNFVDGDATNDLMGYWYAYSDTNTAKPLDSATGASNATMVVTPGDEEFGDPGLATFSAGLHKTVAGSAFAYRPYSGWAAIGTGFEGDGNLLGSMLTGIEFSIKAAAGAIGPNVEAVNFKVTIPGVADAVTHLVSIPVRQFTVGSPEFSTSVCVRPEDLKQPSWIKPADATPFSPDRISKLAWEIKIADEANSAINKDTAVITLTGVKLHGMPAFEIEPGVGVKRGAAKSAFRAIYANGVLSVAGVSGYKTLSVVSPAGKTLASFDAKIGANSVKLDRGTYFVVARGEAGKTLSRKLVVLK